MPFSLNHITISFDYEISPSFKQKSEWYEKQCDCFKQVYYLI